MNRRISSIAAPDGARRGGSAPARGGRVRHLAIAGGILAAAAAAVQTLPPSPATASSGQPPVQQPIPEPKSAIDSFAEPRGATVELFATLADGDTVIDLLKRAGVEKEDARRASSLIADALPGGVPQSTEMAILLGESISGSARRLERLSFEPSPALKVTIGRIATGELKLARDGMNVDAKPRRFTGNVGTDLFWSLRAAGVPADSASEFVEAASRRLNLRQLAPTDRFEIVIDHLRAQTGESRAGPLLYAALSRAGTDRLTLVRWTAGGRTDLFDPNEPNQRTDGFAQPVNAPVSSRFGYRVHPILRFARLHQGVDFGAGWGTPVVAAADGRVSGAEWSGGYGRQVRIAHAGEVLTSYSHLSSIAVAPGTYVRRGDILGYVGSSGLSTGPHLHFEVRKNGRPVDPLTFEFAAAPISPSDAAAIRARANQLRGV